ncbi:MAG: SIS domain-containing protein, partial [Caldilineaceae bacterium]
MDIMEPGVMIRQVDDLATLHREQLHPIDHQVRAALNSNELLSLHRVYLTGDGDSYHASLAAELAFELLTALPCAPLSAMRFREYGADFMFSSFPGDTLVVGISASGNTQRVAECLQRAAAASDKVITIALTGTPGSRVTQSASRTILVEVPSFGRSPGIRTYTATLLGLYLLAIRIGEVRGRYHNADANQMRAELGAMAGGLAATVDANREVTRRAAAALAQAPYMVWAGSGPSLGTAMFSAAKVVEAAGLFAIGQDLEEWSHVERFAYPDNTPLFVIAPPGRS